MPGKKESLRDAHLYDISIPMLFLEGTRDPFCDLGLLHGVLQKLNANHELETIDGGDHSFRLPKGASRTPGDVHQQMLSASIKWLGTLDGEPSKTRLR